MAKSTIKKSGVAGKTAKGATWLETGKAQAQESQQKSESSESFPVLLGDGPHCNVNVNVGARIGLPNYSSASVGASLTIPCDVTEADIEAAFDFAKSWCEGKVQGMVNEVHGENT